MGFPGARTQVWALCEVWANQRPVIRSRDHTRPIAESDVWANPGNWGFDLPRPDLADAIRRDKGEYFAKKLSRIYKQKKLVKSG